MYSILPSFFYCSKPVFSSFVNGLLHCTVIQQYIKEHSFEVVFIYLFYFMASLGPLRPKLVLKDMFFVFIIPINISSFILTLLRPKLLRIVTVYRMLMFIFINMIRSSIAVFSYK